MYTAHAARTVNPARGITRCFLWLADVGVGPRDNLSWLERARMYRV